MDKIKISVVYRDLEDKLSIEKLWSEPFDDHYKLLNIPFFCKNLALNDIVSIDKDGNDFYFDDLVIESGNSTIQVVIFNILRKEKLIFDLEQFGCNWESMYNQEYLAINIPSEVEYSDVTNYLEKLSNDKILDYREACISSFHKQL